MAQYGILGNYRSFEAAQDIRGSKLYGLQDEKLGKIDDVIFDYATGDIRYVVVDTGDWLSTKKFIVPAGRLRASLEHKDDFIVDLTKQQVETFPPYQETDLESDEQWAEYEGRYRSKWEGGPVMHREGTDRNITPTTKQLSGSREAAQAGWSVQSGPADVDSAEQAANASTGRIIPAGTDSVVISNSAVGIGDRWDTFQSLLRQRRKEAVGTGSATKQESESAGELRRAI